MTFAAPIYLWTLLGLLVPLGIHLWSKREARTIKIGSIELLTESDSRQSQSLRLNEKRLLALRMLVVAALSLILARPQWISREENTPLAYVVEASLLERGSMKEFLDSVATETPVRLLKKGLPEWEGEVPGPAPAQPPNYWQLLPELDSLQADSVVVFTRAYLTGVRSRRPQSPHPVHWVVMDDEPTGPRPALAMEKGGGYEVLTARSAPGYTAYAWTPLEPVEIGGGMQGGAATRTSGNPDSLKLEAGPFAGSTLPLFSRDTLRVAMYHTDSLVDESRYTAAALAALSAFLEWEIQVETLEDPSGAIPPETDLLVWLDTGTPPAWEGRMLSYRPDVLANRPIVFGDCRDCFDLTGPLNTENVVAGHYAEQLLEILVPQSRFREVLEPFDKRQLDGGEIRPGPSAGISGPTRLVRAGTSNWWWAVLLVLLLVERAFTKYRRQ